MKFKPFAFFASRAFAIFLFLSVFQTASAEEGPLRFESGENQVALIELYTSQGCSSCPPADHWLSTLKNKPGIWKKFVPVAFHVDYWDYIGWKDLYADKTFSQRQRSYRQSNKISSVYTPGFVVNGREWRGWFGREKFPKLNSASPGNLSAELNGKTLKLSFNKEIGDLRFYYAVLGVGLSTKVSRGENARKTLKEDFVALRYSSGDGANSEWKTELGAVDTKKAERFALAVWITRKGESTPLQSAGAWLPEESVRNLAATR